MGLLDSMAMKRVYVKQKNADTYTMTHAESMVTKTKKNGENQRNNLNLQYSQNRHAIMTYYSSKLAGLRESLCNPKDDNERKRLESDIEQAQLEMNRALANLDSMKTETENQASASLVGPETYWEQLKESAKQDVQMDDGFIKYYSERIKEALAQLFPSKSATTTSDA